MNSTVSSNDLPGLVERLHAIDWSFSNRSTVHEIESIHPYPAKFIPDIPRSLLECLPAPRGTYVLDPFCGSGTTLVEAQRMDIPAIGIDLNPIACLLSRVKTSALPVDADSVATEIAWAARQLDAEKPAGIPNVDHWFLPDVQGAISAIVRAIETQAPQEARDFLRLALSSIIVRISNQESDTRYAAVRKTVSREMVFDSFLAACGRIHRALKSRTWTTHNVRVIESDILAVAPEQITAPVGMVITSPPYPNAYEYWLYHKYRMWWLGFNPIAVKANEVGARAHFFKRNHHTKDSFREQMSSIVQLLDRVLIESGLACFVIGRSKIHGEIVDNASLITQVAVEQQWQPVTRFERTINSQRKSFNLAHASIQTESIVIFQKK